MFALLQLKSTRDLKVSGSLSYVSNNRTIECIIPKKNQPLKKGNVACDQYCCYRIFFLLVRGVSFNITVQDVFKQSLESFVSVQACICSYEKTLWRFFPETLHCHGKERIASIPYLEAEHSNERYFLRSPNFAKYICKPLVEKEKDLNRKDNTLLDAFYSVTEVRTGLMHYDAIEGWAYFTTCIMPVGPIVIRTGNHLLWGTL